MGAKRQRKDSSDMSFDFSNSKMSAESREIIVDGSRPTVLFYLQRTKNENTVVYEAKMEGETFDPKEQAQVYWLDVAPDAIEKARKKGKNDDRSELIWLEKSMAYGLSTKPAPGREGCFVLT